VKNKSNVAVTNRMVNRILLGLEVAGFLRLQMKYRPRG